LIRMQYLYCKSFQKNYKEESAIRYESKLGRKIRTIWKFDVKRHARSWDYIMSMEAHQNRQLVELDQSGLRSSLEFAKWQSREVSMCRSSILHAYHGGCATYLYVCK
jgi:hypothetical protein